MTFLNGATIRRVADLYLALLHYPVVDRNGRVVTSAITSLDLHDLARSARTYDLGAFFVVHPVPEQREFALRLLEHWQTGYGRLFDARRREALELVRVVATLEEARSQAQAASGTPPALVFTSARSEGGTSFAAIRARVEAPGAVMILLGTGFGLAASVQSQCDLVLEPIRGPGSYNHLSVRAAGSIILDRLRSR